MEMIDFSKGSIIRYQGKEFEVKKQVDMGHILAKDLKTYKEVLLPISDVVNDRQVKTEDRIDDISEKDWQEAKNRLAIIQPIIEKRLGKEKIIEIAKSNNIHYTTIYRWMKRYSDSGLLQSLVPNTINRGPKGHVKISQEADLIMKNAIDTLYLNKQKLPVRTIYREIVKRCKNAQVEPPHENTFRKRIKQLSDEHIMAKRESRQIADRKYRNTDGMFPEGIFPLDVVQIDHTPMDIILVDEIERQPIGRPYLTLAIDVYSRMVVGFYIALEAPSYFSVSQCLSNAILTKERYLQYVGVEGEWKIWGIPRSLHLDNGAEFRSKELQRFCEQYGITISWRPVARPQFGGHIERLIGTSMKEIHTLPGTTFSNINERGQYDSDKESAMTLKELEKWMTEFIVNVYHKRIHNSLHKTPIDKFEEGVFGDGTYPGTGIPAQVADEMKLRIELLPTLERTVQQHGVRIDNITYFADVLRRWIKSVDGNNKPRKFVFKRNPRDISIIYFYDPEIKEYFPIPYRNISYPPISLWELNEITRRLKEKSLEKYDEMVIFDAYERMDKIKNNAQSSTRASRRKESAKQIHKERDQSKIISVKKDEFKNSDFDDLFENIQAFDDIEVYKKDDNEL